jgi:hypothetical protein
MPLPVTEDSIEEGTADKKKKKKKKPKKKVAKPNETLKITQSYNKHQLLSPGEFFSQVLGIAKAKYDFDPQNSESSFYEFGFLKTKMSKIAFLRDLCLSLGLTIAERDYKFSNEKNCKVVEYCFKEADFIAFTPKAKYVTAPVMMEFKTALEAAYRMIKDKNVSLAIHHILAH